MENSSACYCSLSHQTYEKAGSTIKRGAYYGISKYLRAGKRDLSQILGELFLSNTLSVAIGRVSKFWHSCVAGRIFLTQAGPSGVIYSVASRRAVDIEGRKMPRSLIQVMSVTLGLALFVTGISGCKSGESDHPATTVPSQAPPDPAGAAAGGSGMPVPQNR